MIGANTDSSCRIAGKEVKQRLLLDLTNPMLSSGFSALFSNEDRGVAAIGGAATGAGILLLMELALSRLGEVPCSNALLNWCPNLLGNLVSAVVANAAVGRLGVSENAAIEIGCAAGAAVGVATRAVVGFFKASREEAQEGQPQAVNERTPLVQWG
jgi:hypothetical protein